MQGGTRRRVRALAGACFAAVAFAVAAAPASAECANTDLPITAENVPAVRAAVQCLLDEERARNGKRVLARNDILARTAQDHAEDVEARGPFGHTDADGKSTDDRAKARGYEGFAGENLAGGSTAREAWDLLMGDKPHRDSLIEETGWSEVGVGAAPQGPAQDFPVVSIVLGDAGTGGAPPETGGPRPEDQTGSGPPRLSLLRFQRSNGRLYIQGFLRGTSSNRKISIRIRRGSHTIRRSARTAPNGYYYVTVKPPRGSGRLVVTATVTVDGKRLVKRRTSG